MKKVVFLGLILLTSCSGREDKILGSWHYEDRGRYVEIHFAEDFAVLVGSMEKAQLPCNVDQVRYGWADDTLYREQAVAVVVDFQSDSQIVFTPIVEALEQQVLSRLANPLDISRFRWNPPTIFAFDTGFISRETNYLITEKGMDPEIASERKAKLLKFEKKQLDVMSNFSN